ncbi:MAG: FAD-dependent oxidoreductase [Ferruginibacter sp.]
MNPIVIIGNGIAGITCARHVRKKSDQPITVISAETKHFYARTALMYIYMGHMKYEHTKPYEDFFWEKNKIKLVEGFVEKVDTQNTMVVLSSGEKISYDKLIIASGSISRMPALKGVDSKGVQGLYGYPDLLQMEADTKGIKHAVVAGGGLIAIEMAEMLRSRNIGVTMLVREPVYWGTVLPEADALLIGRHIKEHHINLKVNTELQEIVPDEQGRIKSIITKNREEMPCDFLGMAIGVKPNIGFLINGGIEIDKGVLVNHYFETNIANVYGIGDCVQFKDPLPGRKPVEQIWYTGRMHGETLAKTLLNNRTSYKPGPYFNSAKFLDIEYQTYGDVTATISEDMTDFFWEEATGKIALRARFDADGILKGVNVYGMRLRHAVLNDWLIKNQTIDYAIEHLADANFDPEFYKAYEIAITEKYNHDFGKQLKPRKRSWKRLLQLMK